MLKSEAQRFRKLPRWKKKSRPSWGLFVKVNGDKRSFKKYFGAFNGGEAKLKGFGKMRGFLLGLNIKCNPPVEAKIKRISKGKGRAPAYELSVRFSFYRKILSADCTPSKAFKEV